MLYFICALIGLVVASQGNNPLIGLALGLLVAWAYSCNQRIKKIEAQLGIQTLPAHAPTKSVHTPTAVKVEDLKTEFVKSAAPQSSDSSTTTTTPPAPQTIYHPPPCAPALQEKVPTTILKPVVAPTPDPVTLFLKNFFATNAIAKIGVIILFFGFSFLLKYAGELGYFPIEIRLIGCALASFILIALGWKLRNSKTKFALILQGAGIGIFYLTVFASLRIYSLIPPGFALTLLVLSAALASALAVLQDSRALAVLSSLAGFAAPILTSTGHGSHVMLFSYYTILNFGILGIAWYKNWRLLNLIGFICTFIISTFWGGSYYQAEFFSSVEPFLILFFLTYSCLGILSAHKNRLAGIQSLDQYLILGVPFLSFSLQVALVHKTEYGVALSSAAFGAYYVMLARLLFRKLGTELKELVQIFLVTGIIFLTIAIPFALSGRQTSAIWAIEGLGLLWLGIRQKSNFSKWIGILIQILAGLAFFFADSFEGEGLMIFNPFYLGILFLSVSYLVSAYLLVDAADHKDDYQATFGNIFYIASLASWIIGGVLEIRRVLPLFSLMYGEYSEINRAYAEAHQIFCIIIFGTLTTLIIEILPKRSTLVLPAWARLFFVPFLWLSFLRLMEIVDQPLQGLGFIAWLIALCLHIGLVNRHERVLKQPAQAFDHYLSFWLFSAIVISTASNFLEVVSDGSLLWKLAGQNFLIMFLVLMALRSNECWPFGVHKKIYAGIAVIPGLLWLVSSSLYLNLSNSGEAAPLPFIPILNPLDLLQIGSIIILLYWARFAEKQALSISPDRIRLGIVLGFFIFIWLTAFPVRILHHYFGIPWSAETIFSSGIVHTTLSIFWGLVSWVLMRYAVRKAWRPLWISGAVLLAIVVGKLIFIDLSNHQTLARVISFMGTGLLLLIIGYVAPIPPQKKEDKVAEKQLDNS